MIRHKRPRALALLLTTFFSSELHAGSPCAGYLEEPLKQAAQKKRTQCLSRLDPLSMKLPLLPGSTGNVKLDQIRACITPGINFPGNRYYGQCKSPTDLKPEVLDLKINPNARPCGTEEYRTVVANAFLEGTTCMGVDPLELLPICHHESHFQINPRGSVFKKNQEPDDWGLCQVTNDGATTAVDRMRDLHPQNPDPKLQTLRQSQRVNHVLSQWPEDSCNGVRSFYKEAMQTLQAENKGEPNAWGLPCQRVALPDGPLKNVVMAAVLHQKNKYRALSFLVGSEPVPGRGDQNKRPGTPDENKIAQEIALVMFNGGWGNISALFKTFLAKNPLTAGQTWKYNEFKAKWDGFLKEKNEAAVAKGSRGIGFASYAQEVREDLKNLEKQVGVKCSTSLY